MSRMIAEIHIATCHHSGAKLLDLLHNSPNCRKWRCSRYLGSVVSLDVLPFGESVYEHAAPHCVRRPEGERYIVKID